MQKNQYERFMRSNHWPDVEWSWGSIILNVVAVSGSVGMVSWMIYEVVK